MVAVTEEIAVAEAVIEVTVVAEAAMEVAVEVAVEVEAWAASMVLMTDLVVVAVVEEEEASKEVSAAPDVATMPDAEIEAAAAAFAVASVAAHAAVEAVEAEARLLRARSEFSGESHESLVSALAVANPCSYGGQVPPPDMATFQLENTILAKSASSMQQVTAKMAKAKITTVGPKVDTAVSLADQFPLRPAYGDKGKPVVLWANYFKVTTKLDVLYKYTVEVSQVRESPREPEAGATPKKGKGSAAKSQPKEVKGRKLFFVIQALIKEICAVDKSIVLATEFKSQLVSLRPLELPSNPMRLSVPSVGNPEKSDTFDVTINGPSEARVDAVMKYLGGSEDPSADNTFPRHPEVVDALNVLFGFGPRSRVNDVSPVGSSRFFLVNAQAQKRDLSNKIRPLESFRGYFQSLRLATGRMLLNVNVTHGVFKLSGSVQDIFHSFGVYQVRRGDRQNLKHVRTVAKFLPKTRVSVKMMLSDGKIVHRQKAIHGLATPQDIRRKPGERAVQFAGDWEYAGARNVSFWLEQDGKAGRYISVFDYYKMSKFISALGLFELSLTHGL